MSVGYPIFYDCWFHSLLPAFEFRCTINASNSGSHRGQGHAVTKVERRRRIEKRRKHRGPIILSMNSLEPSARSAESPYPKSRTRRSLLTCRSLDCLRTEESADAARRCPECETIGPLNGRGTSVWRSQTRALGSISAKRVRPLQYEHNEEMNNER